MVSEKDGAAVAYPFGILNQDPIVNDEVGDQPVLVVFNANIGTGVVFDRQVDGQTLTFSLAEGLTIIDAETGTIWDGLTGLALDGPLAGENSHPPEKHRILLVWLEGLVSGHTCVRS